MLWLRPIEEVAARALPGTEGAFDPFWSPDSRWVGFAALTDNGDFAGDDFANDGFLADFDIEILHSAHDGVAPHHRSPASAMSRRGRISERPWAPKSDDSTAPIAAECQSFLQSVMT